MKTPRNMRKRNNPRPSPNPISRELGRRKKAARVTNRQINQILEEEQT